MLRPYRLDLYSYYSHLIMAVLEFRAPLKDVRPEIDLGTFVTSSSYVAALIYFMRSSGKPLNSIGALELHWNPAMKDVEVELPGDVQHDVILR